MNCVQRTGIPQCYGALYRNDGCTCPSPPRASATSRRIDELETRLEGALERIAELEEALSANEGDLAHPMPTRARDPKGPT